MRIGQTSLVTFISRFVASAIGFVATIYFARILGAEILGIYSLVLTVVAWVGIGGEVGITNAIAKRISEGVDRDAFFTAGVALVLVSFLLVSIVLTLLRPFVEGYIGAPVLEFVILLLFVSLFYSTVQALLTGHHLVHVQGYLDPVKVTLRGTVQIVFVGLTFGLTGLLVGYSAAYFTVGLLGILIVGPSVTIPDREHFLSLLAYAKYAWLGAVKGRTFGWVDTAVLGFFVSPGLVGIYSVSWTISTFLMTFGTSVSAAIFPEISKISSDKSPQSVAPLVRDAIAYSGLFSLPGLVGGTILSERILRIYGDEFVEGTIVLPVLIAACLIYSYQKQLSTALNAVDRPDLGFRVNVIFVVTNIMLNVGLVYLYGWVGAAVATALSALVALFVGYYLLSHLIQFEVPIAEITRQTFAALVMGAVVYSGLLFEESYRLVNHNFLTVVCLVMIGAAVYFAVLLGISAEFRQVVWTNLPIEVPDPIK